MDLGRRIGESLPREGRLVLLAAIGLLVPGWIKGINLLILLALVVLAVWLVNWRISRRQLHRLRGQRRMPAPLIAGQESHWEAEVRRDRNATTSGVRVIDTGPDHSQEWFIDRIEANQVVRFRGRFVPPERGAYRFNPLKAISSFPFGLARRSATISPAYDAVVLPRMGRLDVSRFQRWLSRIARGDGRLHRLARPSMVHQDDLHGLRPFRPGDNPRWIHWRTSARRNLKMVREFEMDLGQNLILIVEPWSAAAGANDPALEAAISLAATICRAWCQQSTDYLMLAVAGRVPAVVAGHSTHDTALEALRRLALAAGEAVIDAASLLRAIASEAVPEAPVLLVSSRAEGPLSAELRRAWDRPIAVLTPASVPDFYEPPRPTAVRSSAD